MANAIAISGDGKRAVAIYNDSLNELRDLLGKPSVTRASHVRWDSERELWVARRADTGEVLCESKYRGECLKKEVSILGKELIQRL